MNTPQICHKSAKNAPICHKSTKNTPNYHKSATNTPVCHKSTTNIPVCKNTPNYHKSATNAPVCHKSATNIPICHKSTTNTPIHHKSATKQADQELFVLKTSQIILTKAAEDVESDDGVESEDPPQAAKALLTSHGGPGSSFELVKDTRAPHGVRIKVSQVPLWENYKLALSQRWEQRFKELIKYKRQHGDCKDCSNLSGKNPS